MTKLDWCIAVLVSSATCAVGYSAGLDHGSPINAITEIVWIDSHEKDWGKALEEGFNLMCRLVPSK